MQVAQRGTSTSSVTTTGYYTCDRWSADFATAGTWTISQSSTAPEGFYNSFKYDCTIADASLAAGDAMILSQRIEGQNLQQLKKGTSNAESITVSFWVRSNKTGSYIFELYDVDNSRAISQAYTISSADTWEYKTVTFAGDTTGAFNNDNAASLYVNLWLAAGTTFTSGTLQTSWGSLTNANRAVGQVNLADNTANEFYITGVQLEVGSVATPFEHRSYGEELALCQRYYFQTSGLVYALGYGTSPENSAIAQVVSPTTMRATPTVTVSNSSAGDSFIGGASDNNVIYYTATPTANGAPRANMQADAEL